jgi:uncharacterized 2Fe-2S/4Fe-4S cluster protein (DUF4445 family)
MPKEKTVRVTFQPQGRAVAVLSGTKVLEAAALVGLAIDTPCGGQGTCGKCRVQVLAGDWLPTAQDALLFSPAELADGWRLACQTELRHDSAIRVPQESIFASQVQILAEPQKAAAAAIEPAVRKVYMKLAPPSLEDSAADLQRLQRQIGHPLKADLSLLRRLPELLRKNDFAGTAVLTDHRLIGFEPGDTTASCHGAAFDIGTTTLVGSLLDLRTGEELAVASRLNPQVSYGDDVLARIEYASASPAQGAELHKSVAKALSEMIGELCKKAGIERSSVYEVSLAGNTTMEHLLCGIDVAPLGRVPFTPAYAQGLILPAAELGLAIAEGGAAYVFPVIGGFVGGDTSAGILAARLDEAAGPVLLVDIGTNGEIVLAHGGKLLAASTAAGPAFEGARISCGMRAAPGAIEKVLFDGELHCSAIGGATPTGLCGSGLIDVAAELLRNGVVTPEGRMLPPEELPASVPQALRDRVRTTENGQVEFVLHAPAGAKKTRPVTITWRDIRELQLATAAIRAGITVLLRKAGLGTADLRSVLIAGGFGSFIRRSNAQRIGLLPPEMDHSRIHYIGNASLEGSRWALVSVDARKRAEDLAARTEHVELSQDLDFQTVFADSMIFPES